MDSVTKIPPLVGAYEIRDMLGVTRQRVQQIVNTKGFPDPVVSLRMGKAWLKADVEAWVRDNRRAAPPAHR